MSQRRPVPHPSSHRPSQSPPRDPGSVSTQQRNPAYRDDTTGRPPHDPGGVPAGEVGGGDQRRGSRTSGVHNILNPPGSRGPLPASSPRVRRRSAETGQLGSGSSPPRPQGLPGTGSMTPQQARAMPHTRSPAEPTLSGSPQGIHPYALAATRRILTPKSPRTASLSRAAMRTVEAQRLASMPPLPGMTGPPAHAHETSPLGGPPALAAPPQFPGHIPAPGPAAPTPTRPTSSLSRSLSQPMMGHGLPPTSSQEQPPSAHPPRDHDGRPMFSPNSPFATPAGPSRSILGEGGGRWGQLPPGTTTVAGRNLELGQGQQHLISITPTHGEEMLIPVDYHQASKQADEKRMRNAGASARFRLRKKEKDAAQAQGLQKLENHNRDLERRVEELEAERDFYRKEYNRLREIVARTPGMGEWADRAPSPTRSRSVGSYAAENSPLPAPAPAPPLPPPHAHPFSHPQPLAHPHPPPSSYNDPSMMERPARRRRTDSDPHPQLGTPSYRPNTPSSLPPPIPSAPSAYGIPSSPRLSLSPGIARLPPIRFEHPSTGPEFTPPVLGGQPPSSAASSQPGQASGYISYPYETGWATGPRGPPEGGSR
ncbi:hypothetical protein B0T18DRAFT_394683 [Schizothecium vesticola]|uniref:BZIP domain-containing protein n=1 Tax=Schizothecium vesticola TaxID=314040 RepID=A0AA40BQ84_9PEZI|nr:hypothetical protein B0T18DRAFT_394683 [Schizothecium vesticola]